MPQPWDAPHTLAARVNFSVVHLGMRFGGPPRLRLDRNGGALLCANAIFGVDGRSIEEATAGLPPPTPSLAAAWLHL